MTDNESPLIDNPPLTFDQLKAIYQRVNIKTESHRKSFAETFAWRLRHQNLDELERQLKDETIPEWLVQRHFYWSAACFYRSYHCFLSYLALDRKGLETPAAIVEYYSQFYMIQAVCNLFLCHVVELKKEEHKEGLKCKRNRNFLTYVGQGGVRLIPTSEFKQKLGVGRGSAHQIWWKLFSQFSDRIDPNSGLALYLDISKDSDLGPDHRNRINYSEEFMEGFAEIERFDDDLTSLDPLLFADTRCRTDRDFTDIDRFFEGYDPETMDVDESVFWDHRGGWLWNNFTHYLRFLERFDFPQPFISCDKIQKLNQCYLQEDYPKLTKGIDTVLAEFHLRGRSA